MKKTISRLFITLSSILVAVLMAIGCIYLISPKNRGESITASAEQHTSDSLYFTQGASARVSDFTDGFCIRFQINAKQSEFIGGNFISIKLTTNVQNVKFSTDRNAMTSGEDTFQPINSTEWSNIYLPSFTLNQSTQTYQAMIILKVVDPYLDYQLQAYGRSGAVATSDARSLVYLWQKAIENDDPAVERFDDKIENYINRPNDFAVIDQTIVPTSSGLVLDFNMPISLFNLLKTQRQVLTTDEGREVAGLGSAVANPVQVAYKEYTLEIVRSINANNYGGTQSGDQSFVFYGNEVLTAPLGSSIFIGDSFVRVTLPLPGDSEQDYYYYARVNEYTRVEYEEIDVFQYLFVIYPYQSRLYENLETVATSINPPRFSTASLATDILSRDYTMKVGDREALQEIAGIAPSGNEVEVTVNYKTWQGNRVVDTSLTIQAPSAFAQSPVLVFSTLMSLKPEYVDLDDFNVVSSDFYYTESDEWLRQTENRIVMTAKEYTYVYDRTTEKGTLTIVYNDYPYENVHIRIANNDSENHLVLDFYPAETRISEDGTYRTIVFPIAEVENQIHNRLPDWLFDLSQDDFVITGTTSNVSATFSDNKLYVRYKKSAVNELANLSLLATVEIIPDEDYTVTYEYRSVSGTALSYTTETSETMTKKYSWIVGLNYQNFMHDFGGTVNQSISSTVVSGQWIKPIGITKIEDNANKTCRIVVEYEERAVFVLTNNYNDKVKYYALNTNSLVYTGAELAESVGIPTGYRLSKITTTSDKVRISPSDDPKELTVTLRDDVDSGEQIPLRLEMTDEWLLTINYLVPYKDYRIRSGVKDASPSFAEKRTINTKIKVRNYSNIGDLDKDDVYDIIHPLDGDFSSDLLGQSSVSGVTISFDGASTYTIDLSYSVATLIAYDYNGGNRIEIKVPITSFAEWCDYYGNDWTIKYLNTAQRQYFKYTNDIDRDKLYGFFTVAVFKEHVSDLNYYFQKEGSDGVVSIYESKEVKGSKIYQFFDRVDGSILGGVVGGVVGGITGGLGGAIGGTIAGQLVGKTGMAFCELVNDDNYLCYSYFMYIDCTSDVPYYGRNGADDAYDNDSAIKNRVEDIGDWVAEKFSNLWNWGPIQVLKWIVLVIAGIYVIGLIIRAVVWAFNGTKKSNSSGKRKR